MFKKFSLAAVAAVIAASNASAVAPGIAVDSGQFTIGISGYVPVICRASVGASLAPVSGANVDLGGLNEFCNSPNGYEVYADYAPSLASASLIVDGQKINLSNGGSTRISKSSQAAIATHSVALDLSKSQNVGGSISFRIVAL
jgi:hypothetical protein